MTHERFFLKSWVPRLNGRYCPIWAFCESLSEHYIRWKSFSGFRQNLDFWGRTISQNLFFDPGKGYIGKLHEII